MLAMADVAVYAMDFEMRLVELEFDKCWDRLMWS